MKVRGKVDSGQIDGMDLTITITMSVEDWRMAMRQQGTAWPASDLGRYIASVLGHVTKSNEVAFESGQ